MSERSEEGADGLDAGASGVIASTEGGLKPVAKVRERAAHGGVLCLSNSSRSPGSSQSCMCLLYDGVCTICLQGKCHVVVSSCVCATMCLDNSHVDVHTGTIERHMMLHTHLASSVAALVRHSGDTQACLSLLLLQGVW